METQLPNPTTSSSPPKIEEAPVIITPPKRPSFFDNFSHLPLKKVLITIGIVFVSLVVLAFIVSLFKRRPAPRPVVTPTPTPSSQSSVTPSNSPEITPIITTERLPLTALSGHRMLAISQGSTGASQFWLVEFTKEGPQKTLIYSLDGKLIEMTLSPDASQLAYTYVPMTSDSKTGIRVFDIKSKTTTELVSPTERYYRLPSWSSDSLYLAVWGSGESNSLFDMTTKRRLLDLTPSSGQMGPIVFVPGQAKISYTENGTLYESEYSGQKKISLIDQVHTLFSNTQPDLHVYSYSSRYIALHNSLGQLLVFDKSTQDQQILAEGNVASGVFEPFGSVLFFDSSDILLYSDQKKTTYTPGTDDNPLYTFNLGEKKSTAFFANPKTPIVLSSIRRLHSNRSLLINISGFMTFSTSGALTSNCDYTKFGYRYQASPDTISYASPFAILSPDDKYLFNINTNQIADTASCAVSGIIDTTTFTQIGWLK